MCRAPQLIRVPNKRWHNAGALAVNYFLRMDRRRHDHNHDECCVQSVSFSAGDSIADSLGTSVEDCSEGSLQTSLLQDFFAHREQHDDVGDPGLSEMEGEDDPVRGGLSSVTC